MKEIVYDKQVGAWHRFTYDVKPTKRELEVLHDTPWITQAKIEKGALLVRLIEEEMPPKYVRNIKLVGLSLANMMDHFA